MNSLLYVGFGLYAVACIFIGFDAHRRLGKGKDHVTNFFVGGRNIGTIGLALSFASAAASAGTFIGGPGLGYKFGFAGLLLSLPNIATVYLPMGLLAKRINTVARRIGAVNLTDILEARFRSPLVVLLSSLVIVVFYVAYMIAQFTAGGRVLQAFAGIPYSWGLAIFGIVVFFYTAYGGYRAVVNTDILQGIVMALGIPIMIFALIKAGGGFAPLVGALAKESPALVTGPGPSNFMPFTMFLSYWIVWPVLCTAQPAQCQHFIAFKDSRTLNKALIVGAITSIFYYVIGCSFIAPLARPIIPGLSVPDLAIPTFVVKTLHPLLAGLVIAAPFAAIMSTVDSMIIVTTSTLVKNVYQRFMKPSASDDELRKLTSVIPVILGIIVILFAIHPAHLLEIIVIFAWGGLGAAFLPAVLLGLFWKRATGPGAVASILAGAGANIVIYYMKNNPLGIATALWSLLIAFVAMVAVSLMTKPSDGQALEPFFGSAD